MRRLILILCLTCLADPALRAQQQESEARRLARLLEELGQISPQTWQARLHGLESQARGHEARAKKLQQQAVLELGKAKSLRSRAARLKQAMQLLASKRPAARKAPTKPRGPMPSPAKKAPAKKAQPKKAQPKKAQPKRTPPKPKTRAAKTMAKAAPAAITYDDHVQEIFMNQCSACHDGDSKEGGLDLTSFATTRAGGASGTTIVPGNIERSRLYKLVAHLEKPTMPPDEPPIPKAQIALISRWIQQGAPENKAAAARLSRRAAAAAAAQPTPPTRPRFDRPAAMPKDWPNPRLRVPARPPALRAMAASTRSPLLAHAGHRQVLIRASDDLRILANLEFEPGEVELLQFSADANTLLVAGGQAGRRGRVQLVDLASGAVRHTLGRLFDTPLAAAIHPDLQQVALGGSNRLLEVLEVGSGKPSYRLKHPDWVLCAGFSADGHWLASGDRKGSLLLTRCRDGRTLHRLQRHRAAVTALAFSPDSRHVVSASLDGSLRLQRCRDGREIWRRSAGAALCVSFSADGKLIATGGRDGLVRVLRSSGASYSTLPGIGEWIYSLTFSADGKTLFAGDYRGRLTSFDLRRRRRSDQRPAIPRAEGG